eukprot:TRINITY_DN4819_c0_g1_i1.p3 TRINITY_DN4819_c0_g1~~TRINITY_DN4819_c0_g1_i1.p3  ORF type:complete len:214 (+),score=71.04 TRINITY_DN4819_c0_g1_i1:92-733(+)
MATASPVAMKPAVELIAPTPLAACIPEQARFSEPHILPGMRGESEISCILSSKSKPGAQGLRPMPRIRSSHDCSQLVTLPEEDSISVKSWARGSAGDLFALDSASVDGHCEKFPDDLAAADGTRSPVHMAGDAWPSSDAEHSDGADSPGCLSRSPPPRACNPLKISLVVPEKQASIDVLRVSELGAELGLLRLSPAFPISFRTGCGPAKPRRI